MAYTSHGCQYAPEESRWQNGTETLYPFSNSTVLMLDYEVMGLSHFLADILSHGINTSTTQSFLSVAVLPGNNVSAVMANVATSLTNAMRMGLNSTVVRGVVWQQQTVIRIQYAWLALPMALLLLSAALLAASMLGYRSGAPVWKSSAYALWYHGLMEWDEQEVKDLVDGCLEATEEMDESSRTMEVQLCRGSGMKGTFFSSS